MRGSPLAALCVLVACGGERAQSASAAAADASASTDGAVTAPDSGEIADTGATQSPACAPWSDGGSAKACSGVGALMLSAPLVEGVDGGALQPGSDAVVEVTMTNPANGTPVDYPAVCFATQSPGASIGGQNPAWALYVIKPGVTARYAVFVHFDASLAAGTVVGLAAQASASGGCLNGPQLQWDVKLQ